uniref:CSON002503 protein n=1 Tax=Culicoides sonorensis TaxID=179676 RepID=A0A336MJ63_CULSO
MSRIIKDKLHKSEWKPSDSLEFLHNNGIHCDLEIRTQGGWTVKAHSAILGSCSKFLKTCFTENYQGKIPVLYLPDVKPNIIESLLKFVYTGEVPLTEDDTNEFLDVAKMLEIRAITQSSEAKSKNTIDEETFMDENTHDNEDSENNYEEFEDEQDVVQTVSIEKVTHNPSSSKPNLFIEKNVPQFKAKLSKLLVKMLRNLRLISPVLAKPHLLIEFSANPPSLRAKITCPFCHSCQTSHAKLTKDKKYFRQWHYEQFKRHLISFHSGKATSTLDFSSDDEMELDEDENSSFNVFKEDIIVEEGDEIYEDYELNETENEKIFVAGGVLNSKSGSDRNFLMVTKSDEPYLKRRLINSIRSMLTSLNIEYDQDHCSHKISFNMTEEPFNLRALYECFICKKFMSIAYKKKDGKFKQWNTTNLKNHFKTQHLKSE